MGELKSRPDAEKRAHNLNHAVSGCQISGVETAVVAPLYERRPRRSQTGATAMVVTLIRNAGTSGRFVHRSRLAFFACRCWSLVS